MNLTKESDYDLCLAASRYADSLDLALEGLAIRTVGVASPRMADFEALQELASEIRLRIGEVKKRVYARAPGGPI